MTREERELTITYLEEMKEDYIDGEGYERHPLPEYYAIETAIKALDQERSRSAEITQYRYDCEKLMEENERLKKALEQETILEKIRA